MVLIGKREFSKGQAGDFVADLKLTKRALFEEARHRIREGRSEADYEPLFRAWAGLEHLAEVLAEAVREDEERKP